MDELRYNLLKSQRELKWAQQFLLDSELAGIADKKRGDHLAATKRGEGGRSPLVIYPEMTFREFFQVQVNAAQRHVDEAMYSLRYERVMAKWCERQLRQRQNALINGAARSTDPVWLQPMKIDEVIQNRRLIDR